MPQRLCTCISDAKSDRGFSDVREGSWIAGGVPSRADRRSGTEPASNSASLLGRSAVMSLGARERGL